MYKVVFIICPIDTQIFLLFPPSASSSSFCRHRQQLIQQMQMIGSGAIGPQASNAIRHVAAQNGVWSLGNFGGLPPRTAASAAAQDPAVGEPQQQQQEGNQSLFMKSIDENDYRCIFNSCAIPMVSYDHFCLQRVFIVYVASYNSHNESFFTRQLRQWEGRSLIVINYSSTYHNTTNKRFVL